MFVLKLKKTSYEVPRLRIMTWFMTLSMIKLSIHVVAMKLHFERLIPAINPIFIIPISTD